MGISIDAANRAERDRVREREREQTGKLTNRKTERIGELFVIANWSTTSDLQRCIIDTDA